jgi:acyl-CoA reductase-like NAD-dependent aldehyde dehydrogenase
METMRMWIGGEWTAAASGRTVHAVNPATEERIARFPQAGEADIARAARAARKAFPEWSKRPIAERSRMVGRIAREIGEHAADLGALETAHRGTPIRHTIPGYLACADAFETASEAGMSVMNSLIDSGPSVPYYLKPQPVGVCSFSQPWHAPFRNISHRLASALVAGNTCIVECPSHDSLAALRLAEIIDSLGLPPGTLNIVTGTTNEEGRAFCPHRAGDAHPASAHAARVIPFAQGQASPLPLIVLEDADVAVAAGRALLTAFGSSGLTWASPGRYYIHECLYEPFAQNLIEAAERLVVGDPADPATDIGPALSPSHRDAVLRHISEKTRQGATLLSGGGLHMNRLPEKGYFLLPTVLGDMDIAAVTAGHELFGPVVCLSPFCTVNQILELADRQGLGKSVNICTNDPVEESRIETALTAGSLWWDDETQDEEGTEGRPGSVFAHGTNDFAFSIRFGTVYKDYTASFVGRNPPNQN